MSKDLEREFEQVVWKWSNAFQMWNLHVAFCYILKILTCHNLRFGKQWPVDQIWLLLALINEVLLEDRYTHFLFLMHVYGCFFPYNDRTESWVVATENVRIEKPKLLTIWPFTEKVYGPLI